MQITPSPAAAFLADLKQQHDLSDTYFLVDGWLVGCVRMHDHRRETSRPRFIHCARRRPRRF